MTVATGTYDGVRSEDHTSSGKSLKLAGTVITGTVVAADNVGPAPLDRPMMAMITVSGTCCTRLFNTYNPRTGSLWIEQEIIFSLRP